LSKIAHPLLRPNAEDLRDENPHKMRKIPHPPKPIAEDLRGGNPPPTKADRRAQALSVLHDARQVPR
jgi:hypothetical protein